MTTKKVDQGADTPKARPKARRPKAKSAGPKTVSRFQQVKHAELAGDSTDSSPVLGGVVGGLAATEAASGSRVQRLSPTELIPHPFNDAGRSEVGDSERWKDLLRNVEANGVQVPALAVTRAAFIAARPAFSDDLADGTHVLVYGHRRRAAALAVGSPTMPVVVDDAVLENDGDIDQMALENLGREDLSPLAEAELYARYAEVLGLTQKAIAERLGVDQGTVSRKLSLLLLTPDSAVALESGDLSATAAASIAGALPYGPSRRWQRSHQPEQTTSDREDDQNRAVELVLHGGVSPTRAAERVSSERRSRTEAFDRGIRLVADPTAALGGDVVEVNDPDFVGDTVGTIDELTGALIVWGRRPAEPPASSTPEPMTDADDAPASEDDSPARQDTTPQGTADEDVPSEPDDAPAGEEHETDDLTEDLATPETVSDDPAATPSTRTSTDDDEATAAAQARRQACSRASQSVPSKTRVAEVLAEAIAHGIDLASPEVIAQADIWLSGAGDATDTYAVNAAVAWRRVLAGYEVSTVTAGKAWGPAQRAYIELLAERVKTYRPTAWERSNMHAA